MKRPIVQISADNNLDELRQHLNEQLPEFKTFDGIVGITLNGGMSRGYADHLSEVDVTFYLTPEAYQTWKTGRTPVPMGISVLDGQLYDIKALNFVEEGSRKWEDVALWDSSYAEILYDPEGKLHELFEEKLSKSVDPASAEGLLFQCWWYFELAAEIWIHRGDAVQGHHMLNQAVEKLVSVLFLANREYIPHEKWLLHMSRSLSWQPNNWEERLMAAMRTGNMSVISLKERKAAIQALWSEVERYIREIVCPALPVDFTKRSIYDHLMLLVSKGSMTVDEWKQLTSGDIPNGDPFYPVIKIENDRISLDREAFFQITPAEMYSWHYSVLDAVRKK